MKRLVYREYCAMDLERSVSISHTGMPREPRLRTIPRPKKFPPSTMAPGTLPPLNSSDEVRVKANPWARLARSSLRRFLNDSRRHARPGVGRAGHESQCGPKSLFRDHAGHI